MSIGRLAQATGLAAPRATAAGGSAPVPYVADPQYGADSAAWSTGLPVPGAYAPVAPLPSFLAGTPAPAHDPYAAPYAPPYGAPVYAPAPAPAAPIVIADPFIPDPAAPVLTPGAPAQPGVGGPQAAPAPVVAPRPAPAPKAPKPRHGRVAAGPAFAHADDNQSGKLSRQEAKQLKAESFGQLDRNRDGAVTWGEFAKTWLGARSFQRIDRDRDGVLRGAEVAKLTVGKADYDKNDDGAITQSEFLAGRRADKQAPSAKQTQRTSKRVARMFDLADKDLDGTLSGGERGAYKAYDKNQNGAISESEFRRGQAADRQGADRSRWLAGRLTKGQAKRLRADAYGKLKALPRPVIRLDAAKIAALLGSPVANVKQSLPGITRALTEAGMRDRNTFIAMLATIRAEAGGFLPIHEYGGPSYWSQYNGRDDLGNRDGTNDGVRYHGRGFVQLTGRGNYGTYGRAIGVDLVKHPDLALKPTVAAKLLVAYFAGRGIDDRARAGDWEGVRTGVNGGYNGWDTFIGAVRKLQGSKGWFRRV